jgi:hypothetical protein
MLRLSGVTPSCPCLGFEVLPARFALVLRTDVASSQAVVRVVALGDIHRRPT